jgi:hypothetical protein
VSRCRRSLPAVLILVSLALPAAAGAQSAFGPLPQETPQTPTVSTQPVKPLDTTSNDSVSSRTTLLLFVIMILVLGSIVWYIRRDARAAAPVDDRRGNADDIHGHKTSAARHKQERKRQARAKGKRQRQARKKHR